MKKLREYENEDALDLLAELIEPCVDIFTDAELRNAVRAKETKASIIKILLKNKKKQIINVLAIMNGVPVEEYRCNVFTLTKDLIDLFNDEEFTSFFTSAGQTKQNASSGNVMETITEEA